VLTNFFSTEDFSENIVISVIQMAIPLGCFVFVIGIINLFVYAVCQMVEYILLEH
jgi:hypothetical protein